MVSVQTRTTSALLLQIVRGLSACWRVMLQPTFWAALTLGSPTLVASAATSDPTNVCSVAALKSLPLNGVPPFDFRLFQEIVLAQEQVSALTGSGAVANIQDEFGEARQALMGLLRAAEVVSPWIRDGQLVIRGTVAPNVRNHVERQAAVLSDGQRIVARYQNSLRALVGSDLGRLHGAISTARNTLLQQWFESFNGLPKDLGGLTLGVEYERFFWLLMSDCRSPLERMPLPTIVRVPAQVAFLGLEGLPADHGGPANIGVATVGDVTPMEGGVNSRQAWIARLKESTRQAVNDNIPNLTRVIQAANEVQLDELAKRFTGDYVNRNNYLFYAYTAAAPVQSALRDRRQQFAAEASAAAAEALRVEAEARQQRARRNAPPTTPDVLSAVMQAYVEGWRYTILGPNRVAAGSPATVAFGFYPFNMDIEIAQVSCKPAGRAYECSFLITRRVDGDSTIWGSALAQVARETGIERPTVMKYRFEWRGDRLVSPSLTAAFDLKFTTETARAQSDWEFERKRRCEDRWQGTGEASWRCR